MKLARMIVAAVTALSLAGCYWMPSQTSSGEVSVALSVPRAILPFEYEGHLVRVSLYPADQVSAQYSPDWGGNWDPTPDSADDHIRVTFAETANPVPIDGHDYHEVALGYPAETTEGSLTIGDIAVGRKYRLLVNWWYRGPDGNEWDNYAGLSAEFAVVPGGVTEVSIQLYQPY